LEKSQIHIDQQLKGKFETFQPAVPFQFEKIATRLDEKKSRRRTFLLWSSVAAVVFTAVSGTIFLLPDTATVNQTTSKSEIASNAPIASDKNPSSNVSPNSKFEGENTSSPSLGDLVGSNQKSINENTPALSSNTLDCEPPSTHAKSSEGNLKYTNFVLMPQNPMPLPRQADASSMPDSRRHSPQKKTQDPSVDFKNASRFTLNSIGLGLGLTSTSILLYAFKSVRDFVHAKSQQLQNNPQLNKATIKNTLAPQNTEAVLLHFFQKKEGFVMGGLDTVNKG
jgi:hypothetical protein